MAYEFLTIEKEGHVATVTLNRPEKLNALSVKLMQELCDVADAFQQDIETRVIVFRGEGKCFCAGVDLSDPDLQSIAGAGLLERQRKAAIGPRMIEKLHNLSQITIASIKGGAVGGGAVMASALDFRIGEENTFVCYPEINLGMNLSWHGLPLCMRLVGPAKAKRLTILGNKEKAKKLLEWGFLDKVLHVEEHEFYVKQFAQSYAKQPPVAAQMIKRSVNALSGSLDASVMHMDTDQFLLTNTSKDFQEGVQAYLEKRPPEFTGE